MLRLPASRARAGSEWLFPTYQSRALQAKAIAARRIGKPFRLPAQKTSIANSPAKERIMKVTTSQLGDAQVFSIGGRLDSEAAPEFERQCLKEISGATRMLILDLSPLDYL